jgi:hypothetical protein
LPGSGPQNTFGTSPGSGNGGGTLVTYQWFFRSSPTSNFAMVPVSFQNGVGPVNGDAANADSTGTGVNYVPPTSLTSLPGSLDFVRVRYSGTENLPRTCASISNIITAFDDRTAPTVTPKPLADTTVIASGTTCNVSVPLRTGANFGPTDTRNPNGPTATDPICQSTPANKFTIRYFINVTFGSTPPNTGTQPNSPNAVTGPAFNGTEISNPATFSVGTTTRVTLMVSDSSGNYDTTGYRIIVSDTTRPVFTGQRLLTRSTESTTCTANITASELFAPFSDCQQPVAVTFAIFDSTSTGPVASSPTRLGGGTQSGSGQLTDRTFSRGTFFIVFQGTDASGNQSGTGGPSGTGARTSLDTVRLRVVDNQRPIITAPRSDTFNVDAGTCERRFTAANTVAPAVGTDCITQPNFTSFNPDGTVNVPNNTTTLCTNPRSTDNCNVASERVFGPDNSNFEFNTRNTDPALGPVYDNTFFRVGRNTLVYMATDDSGNQSDTSLASAKQFIFIRDNIRPQVFCQTNETLTTSGDSRVTAGSTACTFRISGLTNTFRDNCEVRFVRYQFTQNNAVYFDTTMRTSGSTGSFTVNGPFRVGQTTVKSVAFDTTGLATLGLGSGGASNAAPFTGNNGSDTCSFIVTLNDNTAPVFTCQNFTLTLNSAGQGTLNPNNVATNLQECSPRAQGFTLSQTAFTCANIGTNNVTVTYTDSANNTFSCTAVVTVRSSISVTFSNRTGSFCAGSGSFTVTPSGSAGPFSFDVIDPSPSNPTNPANGTSGTFTGLSAGTFTVRVTDVNTGCTFDTTTTVASTGKVTTDVAITATLGTGSSTTLSSTNTSTRMDVRVSEIGGFNATGFNGAAISFFVFKSELPTGVTLSLTGGSVANNDDWTMTENATEYTFTKRATSIGGTGLNCGQISTVAVTATRTGTPQSGPFGVTFSLNRVAGEDNSLTFNNSFTSRLNVRNP